MGQGQLQDNNGTRTITGKETMRRACTGTEVEAEIGTMLETRPEAGTIGGTWIRTAIWAMRRTSMGTMRRAPSGTGTIRVGRTTVGEWDYGVDMGWGRGGYWDTVWDVDRGREN